MDDSSPFKGMEPFKAPATRTWLAIGLEHAQFSLNPHRPKTLVTALRAVRSDMFQIRIEIEFNTERLKLQRTAEGVAQETIAGIISLLQALETYRDCACRKDAPCTTHRPPGEVN